MNLLPFLALLLLADPAFSVSFTVVVNKLLRTLFGHFSVSNNVLKGKKK